MVADTPPVRAGVLALQGDVREHVRILERLGASVSLIRRPEELAGLEALVIPGGESSVIDKLSRAFGLAVPLREAIQSGLPVYGTCAGLILLADRVIDGIAGQEGFGGLDVTVRRNAFGRQTESFQTSLEVVGFTTPVAATFIRAPEVVAVGSGAAATATLHDGRVVAVEQGNLLGTAFHPEIDGETRFHERLLELARARRLAA